jgi:hypothetical protein
MVADGVKEDSRGPTTAERVRTVFTRATAASFATDDGPLRKCRVPHLLASGDIALSIRNENPYSPTGSAVPAFLELLDHAPGRGRASVRALVWLRGHARVAAPQQVRRLLDVIAASNPDPALLDVGHDDTLVLLSVESIALADSTGASLVDHSQVLAAQPDPFSRFEKAWLQHLEQHHGDMVERLRLHLPRGKRCGEIRVMGLDRYGLVVNTVVHERRRDHRIPFYTPVADEAGLCRALKSLMAHPCARGLHPRG